MKKIGYLTKKKSNGAFYIYLRRSYRKQNKVNHEYIFSFGKMPNALEHMYWIRDNPEKFPTELIERHFNLDDLQEWILTIETGVTSTGRNFGVKNQSS